MSCGICRTMFPEIVPETSDICMECQQNDVYEQMDLSRAAAALDCELERLSLAIPAEVVR